MNSYWQLIPSDNIIVGNLIVTLDPTFGGGELNVTGKYKIDKLHLQPYFFLDCRSV